MHIANKTALLELAKDVNLPTYALEQLGEFVGLLELWNERTNLVSRQDIERIVARHVQESLWFCRPEVLGNARRVLDLGTGAGFPGMVMKIAVPSLQMTLLDSRRMKTVFLQAVVAKLGLQEVSVICDRAEMLAKTSPPLHYDLITCRAVAKLDRLWPWAAPLLRPGGTLAALKGGDLDAERAQFTRRFPDQKPEILSMPILACDPAADRKMVVITNHA